MAADTGPAEARFERYLRSHGISFLRCNSIYEIEREKCSAVCVVGGFAADALGPEAVLAAVHSAARHLQAVRREAAGVVVLSNPEHAPVDLNDWHIRRLLVDHELPAALDTLVIVHERAHAADLRAEAEALGQTLTVMYDPLAKYRWVDAFEVPSSSIRPPRQLFAGERDQWFGMRRHDQTYGFLGPGRPVGPAPGLPTRRSASRPVARKVP